VRGKKHFSACKRANASECAAAGRKEMAAKGKPFAAKLSVAGHPTLLRKDQIVQILPLRRSAGMQNFVLFHTDASFVCFHLAAFLQKRHTNQYMSSPMEYVHETMHPAKNPLDFLLGAQLDKKSEGLFVKLGNISKLSSKVMKCCD